MFLSRRGFHYAASGRLSIIRSRTVVQPYPGLILLDTEYDALNQMNFNLSYELYDLIQFCLHIISGINI